MKIAMFLFALLVLVAAAFAQKGHNPHQSGMKGGPGSGVHGAPHGGPQGGAYNGPTHGHAGGHKRPAY